MLRYFEQQVASLFPVVDAGQGRAYLQRFTQVGIPPRELYAAPLPPGLNQGDIISGLPVRVTQQDGRVAEVRGPAMILSNSCDIDGDPRLLVAPCQPFGPWASTGEAGSIRQNTYYSLLFLPAVPTIGDSVVDLSSIHTISGDLIRVGLADGDLQRIASLTQFGWYFLIAKMTVHLLRPRPPDEIRGEAASPRRLQSMLEALGFKLLSLAARLGSAA